MKPRIGSFFFYAVFIMASSVSISSNEFLGIDPEDENYFKPLLSSGSIKCKDGFKKFTKSQLNDNFCDCPDGTDEPGTSACPKGKFYCRNTGHAPLTIFSSRVNDGICVKCSNSCWEAGKVARDKLEKKIAVYKEGLTLRKQEIEQARLALAKDEEELSQLKNEEKSLEPLVEQLKKNKEQIEEAEEKERLQREKRESEKRDAEEAEKKKSGSVEEPEIESKTVEDADHDPIGLVEDPPMDEDMAKGDDDSITEYDHTEAEGSLENEVQDVDVPEKVEEMHADEHPVDTEKDAYEHTESMSKEELGRLVASRWTGENSGVKTGEVDDTKDDNNERSDEEHKDAHVEEHEEEYDSEADRDDHKYYDAAEEDHDFGVENDDSFSSYKSDDEIEVPETGPSSNPTWLKNIQIFFQNILNSVKFQTPVNLTDAARVRKEYDDSSAKLSKIQARISKLTKKLNQDFGPEKEFYQFYDKCFESKESKYVYKVCPFKQASQEEGHRTTRLGKWKKFEESYRVMVFSDGDGCWNGPDRSLKVRLKCGLKNEVADVDEPSRCEYVALLSTPAVCSEEKLKELEQNLYSCKKEQPQDHDEL